MGISPHRTRLVVAVFATFFGSEGVILQYHDVASKSGHSESMMRRSTGLDASGTTSGTSRIHLPDQSVMLDAHVLNLDDRQDRWTAVMLAWAPVKSVRLSRAPALGHYSAEVAGTRRLINGCTESMVYAAMKYFSECAGCSLLLHLEDDAVPIPNFDELIAPVLEYARGHLEAWHIINLGTSIVYASPHPGDNDSRPNIYQIRTPQLLRSSVWSAAHALLINRNAVSILWSLAQTARQHDLSEAHSYMDYLLSRNKSVITLLSVPSLVHQAPGTSDLPWGGRGAWRNMSSLFIEVDKSLNELMQRVSGATHTIIAYGSGDRGWRGSTITMPYLCDPAWTSHSVRDIMAMDSLSLRISQAFEPITVYVFTNDLTHWAATLQAWSTAATVYLKPILCASYTPRHLFSTTEGPSECLQNALAFGELEVHGLVAVADMYTIPLCGFDLAFISLVIELRSRVHEWKVAVLGTDVTDKQLAACGDYNQGYRPSEQYCRQWSQAFTVTSLPFHASFALLSGGTISDWVTWPRTPTRPDSTVLVSSLDLTSQRPTNGLDNHALGQLVRRIADRLDGTRGSLSRLLHSPYRDDAADSTQDHLSVSHAFVINLHQDVDRWLSMLHAWNATPSIRLIRFPAVPHVHKRLDLIHNGCALSHAALALQYFHSYPDKQVLLLLEDDARPANGFEERFQDILSYAMTHLDAWDIINLGSTLAFNYSSTRIPDFRRNIFQLRSPQLMRTSVWSGAHALLINRRALPAFVRMGLTAATVDIDDPQAHNDWFLSHDSALVTLTSVPSLVYQVPGRSGTLQTTVDYSTLFNEADSRLLSVREGMLKSSQDTVLAVPGADHTLLYPYNNWGQGWLPVASDALDTIHGHVLNLDRRPDRWIRMLDAWAHVNSVQLVRHSARPHERREHHAVNGCALSHYDLVLELFAMDSALDLVLVLEDDSVPKADFDARFPAILEYARSHMEEWHIINLGTVTALASGYEPNMDDRPNLFQYRTPQLLRSSVWLSAHALLVNRRALQAYGRAVSIATKHDRTEHQAQFEFILSLDPRVVTLVAVPSLVVQEAGYSDNDLSNPDQAIFANHSKRFDDADRQLTEVMSFFSRGSSGSAKAYASLDPATPSVILPYSHPSWTALRVQDVEAAVNDDESFIQSIGPIQAYVIVPEVGGPPWKAIVHAWGDVPWLRKHMVRIRSDGLVAGLPASLLFPGADGLITEELRALLCSVDAHGVSQQDVIMLVDSFGIPVPLFNQHLAETLRTLRSLQIADWSSVWFGPYTLSHAVPSPCGGTICKTPPLDSGFSLPAASSMLLNRKHWCNASRQTRSSHSFWYTSAAGTIARPQ